MAALFTALLRWQRFPTLFQGPLLAIAAATLFLALRPPQRSEMNVGAALVWQLWWTLLPFLLLATARGWCAVCPFSALAGLVQRLRPSGLPLPAPWLRRIGPWLALLSLGLLGILFLLLALESNGPTTAALLLIFALATIGTGLLWRGRAWCRYLCPLGLMAGLYSRLSWLRLEAPKDRTRAAFVAGRCCPVFTTPTSSRGAQDCVLCGACLKSPGGEEITARLRAPSLSEEVLSPPEAVAVSLLLGLLLVDAWRMTPLYLRYMAWAVPHFGGSYATAQAVALIAVGGSLPLLQGALVLVFGRGRWSWPRFGRLSLILLPLALATQLGLSAQHLMAAGEVLRNLGAELGILAPGHMPPTDAYLVLWPLKALQWLMLLAAGAVSVRLATGRSSVPRPLPLAATLLGVVVLLGLFAEPMSLAC